MNNEHEFYPHRSMYRAKVIHQAMTYDKNDAPLFRLTTVLQATVAADGTEKTLDDALKTEKELFFGFKTEKIAQSVRDLKALGVKFNGLEDLELLDPTHPRPINLIGKTVTLTASHGAEDPKTHSPKVWWNVYNPPRKVTTSAWKQYLEENADAFENALNPEEVPF